MASAVREISSVALANAETEITARPPNTPAAPVITWRRLAALACGCRSFSLSITRPLIVPSCIISSTISTLATMRLSAAPAWKHEFRVSSNQDFAGYNARGASMREAPTGEVGMNAKDFRRIALRMEGAEEGSHMGAVDFRVGGRIFATLAHEKQGYG